MAKAIRMTVSLPAETARAMASISRRLHISRSALLAELLTEPIAALEKLVDLVPQGKATEGDVKRFRGASIDLINQMVTEAQEEAAKLDGAPKLL